MAKYHPNEPLPPAPMFYVVDYRALDRVRRVMRRLFSEQRMYGDTMRDAAQALELTMREAEPFNEFAPLEDVAPAQPGAAFTAYAKDRAARGLAPLDQDPKRCTCRPNGADGSYTGSEAPCDHCMARRIADADVNPEGYFRE